MRLLAKWLFQILTHTYQPVGRDTGLSAFGAFGVFDVVGAVDTMSGLVRVLRSWWLRYLVLLGAHPCSGAGSEPKTQGSQNPSPLRAHLSDRHAQLVLDIKSLQNAKLTNQDFSTLVRSSFFFNGKTDP